MDGRRSRALRGFLGRRFPLLVALTNLGEDQVAAAAMLCEEAAADAISRRLQADELADAVEAGDVTRPVRRPLKGGGTTTLANPAS